MYGMEVLVRNSKKGEVLLKYCENFCKITLTALDLMMPVLRTVSISGSDLRARMTPSV